MKRLFALFTVLILTGCLSSNDEDNDSDQMEVMITLEEGVHYTVIPESQHITHGTPSKVTVTAFFRYGCSLCHEFDPKLEAFLKSYGDGAELIKTPYVKEGLPVIELHAKIFFIRQEVETDDDIDEKLFDLTLNGLVGLEIEDMVVKYAEFFEDYGISSEDFNAKLESDEMKDKMAEAKAFQDKMGVDGTPRVFVGSKYFITNNAFDTFDDMVKGVEQLIALVGSEK